MSLSEVVQSQYFTNAVFALGGVSITWLTQQILNKRGTFSYYVTHNRIGISAEDSIFGVVGVTWNGSSMPNLYLSNLDLVNESMNDYEDIIIRTYTGNTNLLSEQTQMLDTPHILEWSNKYKEQLHVNGTDGPTKTQWEIYNGQREYVIPVMNRGQTVRLSYLNSAKTDNAPSIWLSVVKKGVKLKFRPPQKTIFGIPQPRAALVGVIVGLFVGWILIFSNIPVWIAVLSALIYGLIAQVPGAYVIKIWRKSRELIGS